MISQSLTRDRNVVFNNTTNEWYTPGYIIESVRKVLGTIDLDPASNAKANEIVKATKYYTQETNGYDKEWFGNIFLNPPYGTVKGKSSAALWLQKLIDSYLARNVLQAISIVNAVHDKKWFAMVYDHPLVITSGPLSFIQGNPNSNYSRNIYSSAITYLGPNVDAFYKEFSKYGTPLQKVIIAGDNTSD